jgi:hypothetical protein
MDCEFCKNNFRNKTILKTHQKTAKYCLKLQGVKTVKCFSCKICKSISSSKYNLQRHMMSHTDSEVEMFNSKEELEQQFKDFDTKCKAEIENINIKYNGEVENFKNQLLYQQDIIQDLKKQVESLQRSLERVASKPNVVTNNNTLNIGNFKPITQQLITDEATKLTIEDISEPDGIGYARFVEDICRDKLTCTDYARSILKWKNEEDIVNDPKGEKLWRLLCTAMCSRNEELFREITNRIQVEEVKDADEFMTRLVHCTDHLSAVQGGKRGESSDLQRVVVEHLCRIFKR